MNEWQGNRALRIVAVAFAGALAACGDPDDEADGGGTCTDFDFGEDGADAGPDAGAVCDRGGPSEFPDGGCLATCEEACARLDACGGATAPGCPVAADLCAASCARAMQGGMTWSDVSGHFRCCASQDSCADVAGCGGWLYHPDAIEPCELMCECWESYHDVGAMGSRQLPPPGYAWAPGAVAIVPSGETADYEAGYGAREIARAGVVFVSLPDGPYREIAARRVREREETLPTFVDGGGRLSAATGRIVIEASGPPAAEAARALVAGRGFASVRELGWSKGRLRIAEGGDPWASVDALWELNAIQGVRAELDMIRVFERRYAPDDPLFPDQWHLLNEGQDDPEIAGGAQLAVEGVDGRVSEAWDVEAGDPAIVIAVLDDGVNLGHPDLAPNLAAEPYNFPENWQDYMGEPYGSDVIASHGTCCAGVAAARGDNGVGVSGVCPQCTLLPALIWDQSIYPESPEDSLPLGSSLLMTDAALAGWVTDLADLGAAIISNSWGLGGEDPNFEGSVGAFPTLPAIVGSAFDYAETDGRGGLGTLIVFAAGNSNMDVTTDPYLSHEAVVGAAAIDDQGLKSYYSSYGGTIDVAAPSNGGLLGIATTAQSPDAAGDPQYDLQFGGTSSATPFVAGALGLVLSANPALTAAAARQALTDSATEVDPAWGEWEDGFSPFYGHGVVDAFRAVQMATGACADPATCPAPSDACAADCDGTACDPCRTENDCADGWRCQALPALGEAVCVEAVASDTCGADFTYANGYCLPTRAACGMCGASELCNGRDDDCDGYVDEELTACNEASPPTHSFRCLQEGAGCPDGSACAATICVEGLCADAAGCATGEECVHVKTRYGDVEAAIGVCTTPQVNTGCIDRCMVRDSSAVDEEMQAFADCLAEMTECTEAALDACRDLLPTGE